MTLEDQMTDETKEFDNGQPYCGLATELVADMLAIVKAVEAFRPETQGIKGFYRVTLNAEKGTLTVGKIQSDGTVTLLEMVDVNPAHTEMFGASILPVNYGEPQ